MLLLRLMPMIFFCHDAAIAMLLLFADMLRVFAARFMPPIDFDGGCCCRCFRYCRRYYFRAVECPRAAIAIDYLYMPLRDTTFTITIYDAAAAATYAVLSASSATPCRAFAMYTPLSPGATPASAICYATPLCDALSAATCHAGARR